MKVSSRELMMVVAFIAMMMASLRVGGLFAVVACCLTAVFLTCLVIVAFVGTRERRAYAIGFLTPVLIYGGIHFASNNNELDPFDDFALPTTQSFRPLYRAMVNSSWIDAATGKVLTNYDPTANPVRHAGGGMLPPGMSMVTSRETPARATFSLSLHTMIAVLLGFAGSRFGVYIHAKDESG